MKKYHQRTLVLNLDYTPIALVSWQRAMRKILQGRLIVVKTYKDDYIRGVKDRRYEIPAVVQATQYIKRKKGVPFSRKNVFLRDKLTCQYCGFHDGTVRNLTYDHVIPRSKWNGGVHDVTDWHNIVTCCRSCNNKKGDRTPEQANMPLKRKPTVPSPHPYILGLAPWSVVPPEWEEYLQGNAIYKGIKFKTVEEFENDKTMLKYGSIDGYISKLSARARSS